MGSPLRIRAASPDDAQALAAIYAPYVEYTAITFEYESPSPADFAQRISRTLDDYPYLIAEAQGKVLGYAYASAFQSRPAYAWATEASVYVRQTCRRQGVGRSLYAALERCLQAQGILNLNACIACPEGEDPYLTRDSLNFHQQMGYRTVGQFHRCGYKFHRWYDMVWMEKELGSHLADQPPVRPFSTLTGELFPMECPTDLLHK